MSDWRETTLGEVASVSWGDTKTTKSSYVDEGFRAYSASGPDGFLTKADRHGDGVVISAIGAQCGKTWLAKGDWSCIKNTMWFQAGLEADTRFLYYATSDPDMWPKRGAAQPFIGLGDAKSLQLRLPHLEVQRQISSILGAIDDLIENNRRRVEVLEEMARAIYREWFVRFRYPGHEDVPLVDSPLGPIPEGWDVSDLGSLANLRGGSTVTKKDYAPVGYTAFSASGPDGFLADFEVDGKGVVLSAVGARCGRTFRASGRWSSIANTIKILPRPDRCGPSWLALSLGDPSIFPKRGSAQPFVSINDARDLQLAAPPIAVMQGFEQAVGPMFDLVDALALATNSMTALRDLLLPKLVTGQIDVSHLDLDALTEAATG